MTTNANTTTTDALAAIEARVQALAAKTSTAKRVKGGRECSCGCGEMTKGGMFRPGHDAKLLHKRLLEIRAAATKPTTPEPTEEKPTEPTTDQPTQPTDAPAETRQTDQSANRTASGRKPKAA